MRHLIGYCLKDPEKWNEAIGAFLNDPENQDAQDPPPEDGGGAADPEAGKKYFRSHPSNCKIIASVLYWILVREIVQSYKPVKQTTPNDKIGEELQPGTTDDIIFDASGDGSSPDPEAEPSLDDSPTSKPKNRKRPENKSPMIKGLYSEQDLEGLLGNKLFVEDALGRMKAITSRFNKELAQVDLCMKMRETRNVLGLKKRIIRATEKRFPAYPDILEEYFYGIQKKFRIKTKELEEDYKGNKYDPVEEEPAEPGDDGDRPPEDGPGEDEPMPDGGGDGGDS